MLFFTFSPGFNGHGVEGAGGVAFFYYCLGLSFHFIKAITAGKFFLGKLAWNQPL